MKFLKYEFDLGSDDAVEVRLDKQANVRILDAPNFEHFCCGRPHTSLGGLVTASPVILRPPHAGHWYLVIDLGGFAGTVNVSAYVV